MDSHYCVGLLTYGWILLHVIFSRGSTAILLAKITLPGFQFLLQTSIVSHPTIKSRQSAKNVTREQSLGEVYSHVQSLATAHQT